MSIKNRYVALLIVFAVLLFFINEVSSFYADLESKKNQIYIENRKIIDRVIENEKEKLKAIALQISLDLDIKEAYINNNPEKIKKEYRELWERLKSDGTIYELHLFKPPSHSFVNFSNFDSMGRDIKNSRTDMFWVLSSFEDSSHMLVCRTYPGIRATYPIVDGGNILGGVSAGKEINTIAKVLNTNFNKNSIIAYDKRNFENMKSDFKKSFLEDKKVYDDFYIYDELNIIPQNHLSKLEIKEGAYDLDIDDKYYFVTSYELKDFHSNSIGYIMIFNDLTEFYSSFYEKEIKNILIFIFGLALAYLFVSRNVKKVVYTMNALSHVTDRFRERDFSYVDGFDKDGAEKYESKNELNRLENNIKLMGAHLRDHYEELEVEVELKTKELKNRFYIDHLTELPNINALVRDISTYKSPKLAIIKLVNQNSIKALYGIGAGEFITKQIASILKKSCSDSTRAYKTESNRFAILADEIDLADFYQNIVKTTIFNIEHLSYFYKENEIEITVDTLIGICDEKEHIIEKAEIALYDAKNNNMHYQVYSDKLDYINIFEHNIDISKIIKHCIENNKVSICYQPIVDIDGKVKKYEALMRLVYEDRILTPFEFLDFAKQTRYYQELTKAVIKGSFEMFKGRGIDFSVNLAAQDINSQDIFSYIIEALSSYPNPENVWFEITESESIDSIESLKEFIDALREFGVKIAIDDFGSGYSNFSYLLSIEPDILKIDGSIIRNIDKDEKSYAISKTIVSFAKTLNTKTVGEFVSSKEIFDACVKIGVDEFQGYYFSEPLTAIALMSKLESEK